MKNFYGLFGKNVFSKMFMMVAVFMAMSGGLFGGTLSFLAETMDADSDGHLDYVRIMPKNGDAVVNVKIHGSANELGGLFYQLDGYSNPTQIFDGKLYKKSGDNFQELSQNDRDSINEFYIKLKSGYSNYSTNKTFSIKRYDTNNAFITEVSETVHFPLADITSKDGAKPILMDVVAKSNHGFEDNITLTFSEPIRSAGGLSIVEKIADGNLSFQEINRNFDYNVSFISFQGDKSIMVFKINDGISQENFISSSASSITAKIGDNILSDYYGNSGNSNNVSVTNKASSTTITKDTVRPKIIEVTKFDLNSSFTIIAKVDELLKNTDDMHLEVHNSSMAPNDIWKLETKAEYNAEDKTLMVSFANNKKDIVELRRLLSSGTSEVKIASGSSATDAIGNSVSMDNTAISTSVYVADDTNATASAITYMPLKAIRISFSDKISQPIGTILQYLDINYTSGASIRPTDSSSIINQDILLEFSSNLQIGDNVTIRTNNEYNNSYSGTPYKLTNYAGLPLNPFSKTVEITSPGPLLTYKPVKLDMNAGEIVLSFNNVNATNKLLALSGNNFGSDDINISIDTNSYEELKTDYYNATLTDNEQNITMTLTPKGLNKLRIYLSDKAKSDIKLSVAKLLIIKDRYSRSPESNNGITLSQYIQDETDPVVENWTFDLDGPKPKIRINFNIPISFDSTKISKKFVIASGANQAIFNKIVNDDEDDSFGYFNAIDVGTGSSDTKVKLEDNKTTLTFDLNDSFAREILNDWNLSTSTSNAFLVIKKDNGIFNINKLADNNLSETNASNTPNALSVLTATKGNVNILFTRLGVNFLPDNNAISKSKEINDSKWYLQTIPAGVNLLINKIKGVDDNLIFNKVWGLDGSTWKQTGIILDSKNGYWFRSQKQEIALIRTTLNSSKKQETIEEFESRIKALPENTYILVGVTNDVNRQTDIQNWTKSDSCVVYSHIYKPSTSSSEGWGKWDKDDDGKTIHNFKVGDAMWVKQNCNNTGTKPDDQILSN